MKDIGNFHYPKSSENRLDCGGNCPSRHLDGAYWAGANCPYYQMTS
jgi:hypothetical protein